MKKAWTQITNFAKAIVTILLLLMVPCVSATAQTAAGKNQSAAAKQSSAQADTLRFPSYSYIRFVDGGESVTLSDRVFNDISGKLVFPINRYDMPANSQLLRQLREEVIPMINRDSLEMVCMVIRGAASPEGPQRFNRFLGEQRAKTLADFVNSRLAIPVAEDRQVFDIEYEDYATLCLMMEQQGDSDADTVRALCERYTPDRDFRHLKLALQGIGHGRLWRRLQKEYFSELRAARIVIFLKKITPYRLPPVDGVAVAPPRRAPHITDLYQAVNTTMLSAERQPRRELLSVKTNLLFDFAYVPGYNRWCPIPNIAVEYYPRRGHFTYGASIDFPWWKDYWAHKYFEVRNYQLETRYYLKTHQSPAFSGFYLQGYAHAGIFCLCFNADKGWIGEAVGAGVGLGYVLPISRNGHWRLEFGAQFGIMLAKYDPFQFEYRGKFDLQDHLYYYDWTRPAHEFKQRQYRYTWFGPTRIGITLTYDLLYRRAKGGASLKAYEPQNTQWPQNTQERRTAP